MRGQHSHAPVPWAALEAWFRVVAPLAGPSAGSGTTVEAFDFAVSGAAGNRTLDFMTASPVPLSRNMSALMILRGRCLAAGGLPAGTCDRT